MNSTPQKIEPQKVTKPIQLLAAWLVGLTVVDGSFLAAAVQMDVGGWERGALVIAAILNVPVFLVALFLLQTKFRPELQEDEFYSEYLDKKTNILVKVGRDNIIDNELTAIRTELRLLTSGTPAHSASPEGSKSNTQIGHRWRIGLNSRLPDFDKLRTLLKERSIPLSSVFGPDERLIARQVALAHYMDFESTLQVLDLAFEMKMDAYTYFDPEEEDTREQILIGSYGNAPYPITATLRDLLQSSPDEADLRVYEQGHEAGS